MQIENWRKCWKVDCTPPMEVYRDHINFYGTNIKIDEIDGAIAHHKRQADVLMEAKEIWEREFKD